MRRIEHQLENLIKHSENMIALVTLTLFLITIIVIIFNILGTNPVSIYGGQNQSQDNPCEEPTIIDKSLKIQLVTSGLKKPTSMAFLDNGEMIVLELANGTCEKNSK